MITYNPKSWVSLIFAFHKSDTIRILWKEMIYIGLFSLLLAFVQIQYFNKVATLEKLTVVYSLVGFVISLLLVFRTNTAYDRWWEGRKKWGELVNDTRNLAVKIKTCIPSKDDHLYFSRMIPNFVFATKEHLRGGLLWEEFELEDQEKEWLKNKEHVPLALVELMYQRLQQLKRSHDLSDSDYFVIDKNLNALLNSLGACERIKNTPIPYSYSLFFKKFIFIYVTTLPLAFVHSFGYYSSLITVMIFYILVSMEVLAEEIEDPFGRDDNDLPTDTLAEKIKSNVAQVLG